MADYIDTSYNLQRIGARLAWPAPMAEHRVLLDAFAEARRTWDDLVGLQTDVMAGSGNLREDDLLELDRRVEAHRLALDGLAGVLDIPRASMTMRLSEP